ncbi:lipid II flippase MurJ [Longispora sp. NPDC051575]|uniref:murein biosynthesis integral membrane protein MurJ n=1 Tax=Longispora sp. NPDC051575 TaxID=3154943 RepID=UPI003429BA24
MFALLAALSTLAAPWISGLLSGGATPEAGRHLVTTWSYLTLPAILLYGVFALLTAVLNAHDEFAVPVWAPIANNLALMGTAGAFLLLPGPKDLTPESITSAQVAVLGGGTLLAVGCQVVALWPALRRTGWRWRARFDVRRAELASLGRLAGWTLLYLGVSQAGVLVVLKLARVASDQGGPGPAIYNNGYLLLMMGYGIAALPIITALVPRLTRAATDPHPSADQRHPEGEWHSAKGRSLAAAELSLGGRLIAVVASPVALAFVVLGVPIAVTVFQWGRYTHDQAVSTGTVIAVAGAGLLPYAISQLQTFAFFALADLRTPALLNIPVTLVRVASALLVVHVVPVRWIAAGLMASNALSYLAAAICGAVLLRRRLGPAPTAHVRTTVLRLLIPIAVAAGLSAAVVVTLPGDKLSAGAALLLSGTVLVAAYVGGCFLMRVEDVRRLAAYVRARITRA